MIIDNQVSTDLWNVKVALRGVINDEIAYNDVMKQMDNFRDLEDKLDWGLDLLELLLNKGNALKKNIELHQQPVDPETFLLDPYFLGKGGEVYPEVLKAYVEMSSGKYDEAVLTGGIGSGKTQTALYATGYQTYLLSCYINPQVSFGLDKSSEIKMIFQSLRKKTAVDVDYARFRAMIEASPYFRNEFPYDTNLDSMLVFPNRILIEPLSGSETSAIGQNVIGGVIDEINFMAVVQNSKQASDGGVYNQAIELYNSIARRRKTRFSQVGKGMAGLLCVVSSKKVPNEFTDVKIAESKTNPRIFVYDKRVWDVKPNSFTGETFRLYIGNQTNRPRIIQDDEEPREHELPLIDHIPIEFKTEFEEDIVKSVRDIAGHTTLVTSPFFTNTDKLLSCFGKTQSIALQETIDFSVEKLNIDKSRITNTKWHRYAHVDLALTGDSAGVSICHVPYFVDVVELDMESNKPIVVKKPYVVADLVLEIKPPKMGEIDFSRIRAILFAVRELGIPLKWVSFDSFQSRDSMQILSRKGFTTGLLSVDTSMDAYESFKDAVKDERLELPFHEKLKKETVALEVDYAKGKVDHNALNCFVGETLVKCIDGDKSFLQLIAEHEKGIVNYGYAYTGSNVEVVPLSNPRYTKEVTELVEVTLDNGSKFLCTPDHRFMLEDGSYMEAQYLEGKLVKE